MGTKVVQNIRDNWRAYGYRWGMFINQ
jgi:hypothetical protein